MSPSQKFSISLSEETMNKIAKRTKKGMGRSELIARELNRLYSVYVWALIDINEKFSSDELVALAMVGGASVGLDDYPDATMLARTLVIDIEASIEENDLADRVKFDVYEFLSKVKALELAELMAIHDSLERIRNYTNEHGSISTTDIPNYFKPYI